MSQYFHKLPSEIVFLENEYMAYCFNEAVAYIIQEMNAGKTPNFDIKKDKNESKEGNKVYHSFSSIYSKYNV